MPLFYTPFLYKSLDQDIIRTHINPGYDRLNGQFVKTYTRYDIDRSLHGKLFLDEYGHKGIGYGNELDLKNSSGASNGGLYGYNIKEKHTGLERWALFGDHFQVLPSSVNFQMRLQAQSDTNFDNDYNRSNSYAVTTQLVDNAAFTRTTKLYTTHLSYSRIDNQDPLVLTRYDKASEDYPRLDFQTSQVKISSLPWLNTFSGFADNNYTQGLGYLERSAGAGWQARKSIRLFNGVTFEPNAALSDTYQSRFDDTITPSVDATRTYLDSYIGRYTGGGDLRFKTPFGLSDVTETYTQRLTPNTFNSDSAAVNHGVESNLLGLSHILRPSRSVYVHITGGYDWRDFRDHTVGFRDRVQPLTADVTWLPTRNWSLLVHDNYQLDGGNQNFAIQSDWGHRNESFFGVGFDNAQSTTTANTTATTYHYFVSQDFSFYISSPTWKFVGAMREDVGDARGGLHFNILTVFDKELQIQRIWHDFITLVILRERPGGVKEASFRVQLKLDTKRPIGPSAASDTPWRTWKSDD